MKILQKYRISKGMFKKKKVMNVWNATDSINRKFICVKYHGQESWSHKGGARLHRVEELV
jgi:hypothetical protein